MPTNPQSQNSVATARRKRAVKPCQGAVSPCNLIEGLLALSLVALLGAGCAVTPRSQRILPAQTAASPPATQINSALAQVTSGGPTSTADYRLGADDLI